MAMTKEFTDTVQSGNKLRVRIMLKDSLLIDPTFAQFDEMVNFAESQIEDLYDEKDSDELIYDESAWSKEYLNQEMAAVVNNFSRERIELLKNMIRKYYGNKVTVNDNVKESHKEISRKNIGIGVTACGAVLAVVGICSSHTALTVGGIAVTVAGVAIIVSDKENM